MSPVDERTASQNQVARDKWKQRTALQKTLVDIFAYILNVISLMIISSQMFPGGMGTSIKYWTDWTLRRPLDLESVATVTDTWEAIRFKILDNVHAQEFHYDGETRRTFAEKQFAADMSNFRLGPARFYQFRTECDDFDRGWKNIITDMTEKERNEFQESPLKAPWLRSNKTSVPSDWYSFTVRVPREFGDCGYEAELGHTKASGKFMAKFLETYNWLDNKTTLVFFEQSYLNIPLSTFLMQRVSFQFSYGGGVHANVRITQELKFLYGLK